MAASGKVQVISTKYFMCINWGHFVIYPQNMKFERLILWPRGAYTDAMHFLIHESWLHRLIGKYPKWAKKSIWQVQNVSKIFKLYWYKPLKAMFWGAMAAPMRPHFCTQLGMHSCLSLTSLYSHWYLWDFMTYPTPEHFWTRISPFAGSPSQSPFR